MFKVTISSLGKRYSDKIEVAMSILSASHIAQQILQR